MTVPVLIRVHVDLMRCESPHRRMLRLYICDVLYVPRLVTGANRPETVHHPHHDSPARSQRSDSGDAISDDPTQGGDFLTLNV